MVEPLPIDDHVPAIVAAIGRARAAVVVAAPGAGKTTRVPPALVADGPVLLLQPRRVAARAIAARIAGERGWTIGREIGWHVRFDRRFSDETRLLVATEGVLTARLQQDRRLRGFRTVVLDEFHERSLHADVGLALVREAWQARDDLRIVVMSATLDAEPVSAFLDGCPIIDVPGRTFPVEVSYRPGIAPGDAILDAAARAAGAVLCFLPGAPEIRRLTDSLSAPLRASGIEVLPLHGGLGADEQDAALRPRGGARVILATNLAETTVTVPDVTAVVDTGLQKVARYDAERAIDSLDTERVSQDSADQRAGRAGRTRPGVAIRLWDARDRLRPHREPEIVRVDLASTVLDVLAWGGDPRTLAWFEAPPRHAIDAAFELLARLGAIADGRVTPLGGKLQRLSLHPRLGRFLLDAGGAVAAARACALLSERHSAPPRSGATSCDLLSAVESATMLPSHVMETARRLRDEARTVLGPEMRESLDDIGFRRAVLAGYPDRVAKRRAPRSDRFLLASGTGVRLARESGVHDAEYVVAVEIAGRASGIAGEAIVRLATGIERDWLEANRRELRHEFDGSSRTVKAVRLERYDELVLSEQPVAPDPREAARLLAAEFLRRELEPADEQLVRRLQFAGLDIGVAALVERAAGAAARLDDIVLESQLTAAERGALARGAPAAVALPGGTQLRLDYRGDGRAVAAVRLQKLFGVTDTPRVGPRRVPVTFELLAPNGRPVQVTSDLASFWKNAYPALRTQLKARYPKHQW